MNQDLNRLQYNTSNCWKVAFWNVHNPMFTIGVLGKQNYGEVKESTLIFLTVSVVIAILPEMSSWYLNIRSIT